MVCKCRANFLFCKFQSTLLAHTNNNIWGLLIILFRAIFAINLIPKSLSVLMRLFSYGASWKRGGETAIHMYYNHIWASFVLHLFNVICTAKVAKLLQGKQGNGRQHSWFSVPGAALRAGQAQLIPQWPVLLQPRGNLVVTINHCQLLHVCSSLCLEGSKSELVSGLKSQLGLVQHFGRATSPWPRKFYPVNNWREEEFE